MARILVIDDEPDMLRGVSDNLRFEGHDVETAADGLQGLDMLISTSYDCAILDVMLPGMNGMDVCRTCRARGVTTPILMLTARGGELDTVLGLELGADDYLTKPFSVRELLARIKALLRRQELARGSASAPSPAGIRIGRIDFNFEQWTATEHGETIPFTHREMELVKYLWEHRGAPVSRDALLEDVWGYDTAISTRSIDNFMLKLRQKIETDPAHPRCIITVHGTGYRLIT